MTPSHFLIDYAVCLRSLSICKIKYSFFLVHTSQLFPSTTLLEYSSRSRVNFIFNPIQIAHTLTRYTAPGYNTTITMLNHLRNVVVGKILIELSPKIKFSYNPKICTIVPPNNCFHSPDRGPLFWFLQLGKKLQCLTNFHLNFCLSEI